MALRRPSFAAFCEKRLTAGGLRLTRPPPGESLAPPVAFRMLLDGLTCGSIMLPLDRESAGKVVGCAGAGCPFDGRDRGTIHRRANRVLGEPGKGDRAAAP